MNYKVRILTTAFDEIVEAYLNKKADEQIGDDKILSRTLFKLRLRSQLNYFWTNPEAFDELTHRELKIQGVDAPITYEMIFEGKEPFMREPQIEWNGEIRKINSIPEIVSFSRVGENIMG